MYSIYKCVTSGKLNSYETIDDINKQQHQNLTSNKYIHQIHSTKIKGQINKIPDLFNVAGKNVFVTRVSRGIGFMIARGFAQYGANVLKSSRSADACKEAATSIGERCSFRACDVGTRQGCVDLVNFISDKFNGRLDVLGKCSTLLI